MLTVGPDATPHGWGARLCLALPNSVLWRRSGDPIDRVRTFADLVGFVEMAGWLESKAGLLESAQQRPAAAAASLGRALALRETLFRLFSAVASGQQPWTDDLAELNASWREAMAALELVPAGLAPSAAGAVAPSPDGFRVRWRDPRHLDLPRWQVSASAALLLASEEVARVKQCPGERCGWVFLDESRNHSRRWCDSRECGNRERVRAHYHRSRPSEPGPEP